MAKKNGHGGRRKGAGRKSVHEELRAKELSKASFEAEFGTLQEAFTFGMKQIKKGDKHSFSYYKLLLAYAFGNPKDSIDLTSGDEPIQNFNLSKLSEKELLVILKLHEGQRTDTDEE